MIWPGWSSGLWLTTWLILSEDQILQLFTNYIIQLNKIPSNATHAWSKQNLLSFTRRRAMIFKSIMNSKHAAHVGLPSNYVYSSEYQNWRQWAAWLRPAASNEFSAMLRNGESSNGLTNADNAFTITFLTDCQASIKCRKSLWYYFYSVSSHELSLLDFSFYRAAFYRIFSFMIHSKAQVLVRLKYVSVLKIHMNDLLNK
jgi:hypothetical protein